MRFMNSLDPKMKNKIAFFNVVIQCDKNTEQSKQDSTSKQTNNKICIY